MALSALQRVLRHARLFQTPADAYRYRQLRRRARSGLASAPVSLRLRALGGASVLCRANQDVWTLKYTFIEGFHRPPRALPDGATIVDLGSNVGYTIADLAVRHPSARIIGVEMDADNFQLALRNVSAFGARVTLLHAAVWVEDGAIAYGGTDADAFHVVDDAATPSLRHAPAKRLDTMFDELNVERVAYLKMDVEGAEAALLEGPLGWTDRVDAMKIELHPPATYERCAEVLTARGFDCRRDDRHWDTLVALRRRGAQRA